MRALARTTLVLALLTLPTLVRAESTCRVPVTIKGALHTLPDALFLSAIVPSVNAQGVAKLDAGNAIADCRGQRTTSFWPDEQPPRQPGTVLIAGKQKLRDGRLAVWVVSDRVMAKPETYRNGYLAIVRLAGNELLVDAVGVWGKAEEVKLTLEEGVFGPGTWVEPFGHTALGGITDLEEHQVWIADGAGLLKSAGGLPISGRDEDTNATWPHWRMAFTSKITPGNKVKLVDHVTWTLIGDKRPEVVETTVTHLYVLDGNRVREIAPAPRKAPRELPKPPLPKSQTIRVPIAAGELELTFDPSKVSEKELSAAVGLSPWGAPNGHALYTIERCLPHDSRYVDCGSGDIDAPGYLTNGEVNMRMNQAALDQVRATKVHAAMAPALEWQRRAMTFYVALEEYRLAFLRTHDPTILRRPIDGIDPMQVCAAAVQKVIELPYGKEQSRALRIDWQSCMHNATGDRFNAVPKEPWLTLLKTTGTTEKLHRTNAD